MRELASKIVDSTKVDASLLGGIGIAFWIQGITLLTAIGGLCLIIFRVAIASQEWRLNRLKLAAAASSPPQNPEGSPEHGS